jgi:hypothetical protein
MLLVHIPEVPVSDAAWHKDYALLSRSKKSPRHYLKLGHCSSFHIPVCASFSKKGCMKIMPLIFYQKIKLQL